MKPIIVGMNNPYSPHPEHALAPWPEKSSGYRLWKMLRDATDDNQVDVCAYRAGHNRADYLEAFDRYNLFGDYTPSTMDSRASWARDFVDRYVPPGSHAILLGHAVLRSIGDAIGCELGPVFAHPQVAAGVTWRWLPHPSGRCTAYNDPAIRMLAGLTLADVLSHCSKEN